MGLPIALMTVGLAAPLDFVVRAVKNIPFAETVIAAATLAVVGVAMLVWAARGRARTSIAICAGGCSLVYLLVATVVFPAFDPQKSARAFALEMRDVTAASRAAGQKVVAFRTGNLPEAFSFYAHFYTAETDDPTVMATHLSRSEQVFAVADEAWLPQLPETLQHRLSVIKRAELNSRNIVLVANHSSGAPP